MSEAIRINGVVDYTANGAQQQNMGPSGAQANGVYGRAPHAAQNKDALFRAVDAEVARAPNSPFAGVVRNGNRLIGDGVSVFSGGINVMASLAALVQMQ